MSAPEYQGAASRAHEVHPLTVAVDDRDPSPLVGERVPPAPAIGTDLEVPNELDRPGLDAHVDASGLVVVAPDVLRERLAVHGQALVDLCAHGGRERWGVADELLAGFLARAIGEAASRRVRRRALHDVERKNHLRRDAIQEGREDGRVGARRPEELGG
jgi:hypothetical protein